MIFQRRCPSRYIGRGMTSPRWTFQSDVPVMEELVVRCEARRGHLGRHFHDTKRGAVFQWADDAAIGAGE